MKWGALVLVAGIAVSIERPLPVTPKSGDDS